MKKEEGRRRSRKRRRRKNVVMRQHGELTGKRIGITLENQREPDFFRCIQDATNDRSGPSIIGEERYRNGELFH